MSSAVVFAYHNVGVRCLSVLLRHGVDVRLVVTHRDNPAENIWFDSVAALAHARGITVITPDDPNTPGVLAQVAAAQPDFLFSFYYRHMLKAALLAVPAREVFDKVSGAAGRALDGVLPALLAGTAPHVAQDLRLGAYFGGRKPEDGRIDFHWPALRIHNFVRALTRPYPGAFADLAGRRVVLWRTALDARRVSPGAPRLVAADGVALECADGATLKVLDLEADGRPVATADFADVFGGSSVQLA